MSRYKFSYSMEIKYSYPVNRCYFTIKCLPKDTFRQKIKDLSIAIFPNTEYCFNEDSFGNQYIYGCENKLHDIFKYSVSGIAKTSSTYEEVSYSKDEMEYAYFTNMTRPGEALRAFASELKFADTDLAYDKAKIIMHSLYKEFTYVSEVTDIHTTANEAWEQGKGVCQDYAHIMIALCRLQGIRARYVTGLIIGENGASHAWVEVLCDGKWYGLDPTNDLLVWEGYIKLGVGRDAYDCAINRGIIIGNGGIQTQIINVRVEEIPLE